ncbi:MAG TPA: hypothetical protein VN257_04600 [Actinotalea sp.]|nr:hypothetical protein [Actinotalea sp.]
MNTSASTSSVTRALRSPRARWAVPGVIAVGVAAAMAATPLLASADAVALPDVTPAELLTAVAESEPTPLSGTVVHTARLGLPEIPMMEMTGADPLALLSGSSTLRVWSDGAERSRVALLGTTSEYSMVTDGPEAWTYSSADQEAVHYTLDAGDLARWESMDPEARAAETFDGELPTPAEAATAALERVEQHSTVALDEPTTVAGRDAYQLAVTPTSDTTLVARIVVAVDAETSAPLRVQVWSRQDATAPALETGFTDVTFAMPDESVFTFSTPAGATTSEVVVPLPEAQDAPDAPQAAGMLPAGVTVTGDGWDAVVQVSDVDVEALLAGDPAAVAVLPEAGRSFGSSDAAQDLVAEFTSEDGSGMPSMPDLDVATLYEQLTTEVAEGRLLSSALLSVLVTDDGRVLVGAVPAETLRSLA